MHFVKYECGCIGLPPSRPAAQSIIIIACDDARFTPDITFRDMQGKPYTQLPSALSRDYWLRLTRLVRRGRQLERLASELHSSIDLNNP